MSRLETDGLTTSPVNLLSKHIQVVLCLKMSTNLVLFCSNLNNYKKLSPMICLTVFYELMQIDKHFYTVYDLMQFTGQYLRFLQGTLLHTT